MEIVRRLKAENLKREGYSVKHLLSFKFHKSIDSAVFYETTIPVNGSFTEQWHKESYEMIYFVSSGIAIVDGVEHHFDIGDMIMMNPNEKHSFRAKGKDLVILAVRFPDLPTDKYT